MIQLGHRFAAGFNGMFLLCKLASAGKVFTTEPAGVAKRQQNASADRAAVTLKAAGGEI
jgi:hypothetical protein